MSKLSPILKIFAFLPPILLLVGTIGTISCGKSIYPTVTATNTSSATATATTGAFAFATNFNDGKISEFTRNTTTGKLTLVGTVAAGSSAGPQGLAATGNFLYAVNSKDDTVLQYTIGSGAVLTPIGTGSVSDGSGTGPEQVVTNQAGTFLWAANTGNGSISGWAITSGTGALTAITGVSGLSAPFGMAVNSAGTILYIADTTAGLIYTFSINTSTGALVQVPGSPTPSLGVSNGSPGLMAIDPTGLYLYVGDLTNGLAVMFSINTTTGLPTFGSSQPLTPTSNKPVGIGVAAISSGTFVLTANQNAGNVWGFQEGVNGILATQPVAYGTLSSPTGLVVDPQNAFVYTANQDSSSIGIFELNVACPTTVQVLCQLSSVATEKSPPSGGSGPYAVILGN
ncbi:MAG: lactonase family protein [Candidatus Binataceae bacterium]